MMMLVMMSDDDDDDDDSDIAATIQPAKTTTLHEYDCDGDMKDAVR